jgi:hypothetical protein
MRIRFVLLLACLSIFAPQIDAQITDASSQQAPPVPGVGHSYIRLLSETVNPATGAVSIRIQGPVPAGREISMPFMFGYDSNSSMHILTSTGVGWTDHSSYLGQGGWFYGLPHLNLTSGVRVVGPGGGPPGQGGNKHHLSLF